MRALKQWKLQIPQIDQPVEMKEARMRALKHHNDHQTPLSSLCRNEGSPYEGIETSHIDLPFTLCYVEMKEARMRALKPKITFLLTRFNV